MTDIRLGNCPICSWHEIVESLPTDFAGHPTIEHRQAVTYDGGYLATSVPDVNRPIGLLLRYTCRRCGYCQTFAEQPGSIPLGEVCKTRLILGTPPPSTPYR